MTTTSLVDNLKPAARDQVKLRDRVLRATATSAEQTYRGNSTILQCDMSAYASFMVAISGDSSQFSVDGSNDLVAWFTLDAQILGVGNGPVGSAFYTENVAFIGAVAITALAGNKQSRFIRIRGGTVSSSRNSSVSLILSQTPFTPTRPTRHLSPDNAWSYVAASGGITNTTPVTIKAATNPYHRNLLTQLQISNGGTSGTEVIITDTAGPTILWRDYLAAGAPRTVAFDPPLRGAASSSLTVTLSAASGASVYANAQGLTALA